jgi:NADH pyrophosphatase NudC (nudix superfamily)
MQQDIDWYDELNDEQLMKLPSHTHMEAYMNDYRLCSYCGDSLESYAHRNKHYCEGCADQAALDDVCQI